MSTYNHDMMYQTPANYQSIYGKEFGNNFEQRATMRYNADSFSSLSIDINEYSDTFQARKTLSKCPDSYQSLCLESYSN